MSWSSFDEGAFLAEVNRHLIAGGQLVDEFLAAAKDGPAETEARDDVGNLSAAQGATESLSPAVQLLTGLLVDPATDRTKLVPFFRSSEEVPLTPPPPELAQRVLGHLVNPLIGLGRRILACYLDTNIRTAWNYPTKIDEEGDDTRLTDIPFYWMIEMMLSTG